VTFQPDALISCRVRPSWEDASVVPSAGNISVNMSASVQIPDWIVTHCAEELGLVFPLSAVTTEDGHRCNVREHRGSSFACDCIQKGFGPFWTYELPKPLPSLSTRDSAVARDVPEASRNVKPALPALATYCDDSFRSLNSRVITENIDVAVVRIVFRSESLGDRLAV
jgi:hypothetical protein